MSKTTKHKGHSDLPSDDFTWTDGSNYGLDGFHYEQTLGEGLRNRGDQSGFSGTYTPAQTSGMSNLPDGFIQPKEASFGWEEFDQQGVDLSTLLGESTLSKKAISLVDLSWLDPNQPQDPDRLPKGLRPDQAPLNSLKALEQAWSLEDRRGPLLIPNKDKDALKYKASLESEPSVKPDMRDVAWHVKKAIRLAHYGEPLASIQGYLQTNMDAKSASKTMDYVRQNYGLFGNVFVQANAFPGLHNGKWAEQLRRVARTALYVVTDNPLAAAKLGKKQVASVPWKQALEHYVPHLTASGYKVAHLDNPKQTLQLAFLSGPEKVAVEVTPKPVDLRPSQTVSLKTAKTLLANTPVETQEVIVRDGSEKARAAVLVRVAKATKAGLITQQQAMRLHISKAPADVIWRTARFFAQSNQIPKNHVYDGQGSLVEHGPRLAEIADIHLAQDELEAYLHRKAQAEVAYLVKVGQLTHQEAMVVLKQKTPEDILRLATQYVLKANLRKDPLPTPTKQANYKGHVFEAAPVTLPNVVELSPDQKALHLAAKTSGIRVSEFQRLARWVRQRMAEGVAGKTLTEMVSLRFASPLRKAGSHILKALRQEHEGLSGYLYVDAEAYASKVGTKGCDTGALNHRTSMVQYVKAMSRCSGCAFANVEGACTKYGKQLLTDIPKDASQFQARMIQAANAPQHENIAALFNPSDYSLSGDLDVDVEDPRMVGDLEDIFLDGIHV